MSKYVIYSALVGAYDMIFQPEVVDDRFDFVLFTNELKEDHVGVWKIRPIVYQNADSTRVARYVKMHPEDLLPEYEVSVWIDMNIRIKTDYLYERAVLLKEKGVMVSSMCHPANDCIYNEAFSVMHMRMERESVVLRWCHKLFRERYPVHNGLCETNVLFRQHNETVRSVDQLWWLCVEGNSRRDQLSFNYVLWKKGVPCHFLMGDGMCARNSEHFEVVAHKDRLHNYCKLEKTEGWLMRYCWKVPQKKEMVQKMYYQIYATSMPKLWAFFWGQLFRMKYLMKNGVSSFMG